MFPKERFEISGMNIGRIFEISGFRRIPLLRILNFFLKDFFFFCPPAINLRTWQSMLISMQNEGIIDLQYLWWGDGEDVESCMIKIDEKLPKYKPSVGPFRFESMLQEFVPKTWCNLFIYSYIWCKSVRLIKYSRNGWKMQFNRINDVENRHLSLELFGENNRQQIPRTSWSLHSFFEFIDSNTQFIWILIRIYIICESYKWDVKLQ